MPFAQPPRSAAWEHRDARTGFEVVFLRARSDGWQLEGDTAAVEDGEAWAVHYDVTVSPDWLTRSARVSGRASSGARQLTVQGDGVGRWRLNGAPARHLDGCLDLDLESSALTNALPVHRLGLEIGQHADAAAAYVRALDLTVERLEQRYVRLSDDGSRHRYHYTAPELGFECELVYDDAGLVLEYPGIAVRAG